MKWLKNNEDDFDIFDVDIEAANECYTQGCSLKECKKHGKFEYLQEKMESDKMQIFIESNSNA